MTGKFRENDSYAFGSFAFGSFANATATEIAFLSVSIQRSQFFITAIKIK
jgi:hypothetical protein